MKNYADAMADALVDVLKYSDSQVEWPDMDPLPSDPTIKPEWFYPALQSNPYSEVSSILLYTQQSGLYDDQIGDLVLGVAFVEMKHFAAIRDVVVKLGGSLPQPYNDSTLKLGDSVSNALVIDIESELQTIRFYRQLRTQITSESATATGIRQMLDKLIADETLHFNLFRKALEKQAPGELIRKLTEQIRSVFPE